MANEKRTFSHPLARTRQPGETSHFPAKLKNFFRITSSGSNNTTSHDNSSIKSDSKSSFKNNRFLPSIGRNRSTTTASEGNPLEEGMSPTAHANPYFVHQGPPALRHHNDGSVPSTPPDGAASKLAVPPIDGESAATTATKEELARKLRRVASAPNAQGMFSSGKEGERPKTAELGKEPMIMQQGSSEAKPKVSMVVQNDGVHLPVPSPDGVPVAPGFRNSIAFRRTYSSNSIKVRNVEVGPGSFDKIKLIGKGDVGKVYLVREKKSSRLFAMKGKHQTSHRLED